MSDTTRDPRKDPKPGDVLRTSTDERIVNAVTSAYVEVHTSRVYQGANWLYPSPGQFRRWAKHAEVIYHAK